MSATESISHPGIIEKLTEDMVFVKIMAMSACSSCHAKGMCNVAEVEEKVVEVKRPPSRDFKVGQIVTVSMKKSLGTYAVLLGYIIPFFLLIGVLVAVLFISGNEGLAGISGILILIPYYWGLYYYRRRLKNTFNFKID